MAQTVIMSLNTIGGIIQGEYGTYQAGADGTAVVDTRDASALLKLGASYISKVNTGYNTPVAPGTATVGQIVASTALANGAIAITNQPDAMRQVAVRVAPGTPGITAGVVAVSYIGNDGLLGTDTLTLVTAANTTLTQFLSRGVEHVSTINVSALAGGGSPHIALDTTATLSVPVGPNAKDFAVGKETLETGDETVGTLSTATLGSIAPTSAPNASHTYSFAYSYIAPEA